MSDEAPKPLQPKAESPEEIRRRLDAESAPQSLEDQETREGVTTEELHRQNAEHARVQQQRDQEELVHVRERLSQQAERPITEASAETSSRLRSSDDMVGRIKQLDEERPRWKKALGLGRVTPENLREKEKEAAKKEILEALSPGGFDGGIANGPSKIKYEHADLTSKIKFSEFVDRIRKFQETGVFSPDDVAEIYRSVKVQKAVEKVFENLYVFHAGYSVDSYPEKPGSFLNRRSWVLYPEDSPEGKAVREAAAQRLAEFLEAGVIDERQAQKIREEEFHKTLLS